MNYLEKGLCDPMTVSNTGDCLRQEYPEVTFYLNGGVVQGFLCLKNIIKNTNAHADN